MLVRKHRLATRWFHWVNFPALTIMIWSGLLIYWANRAYHLGPYMLFSDKLYDKAGMSSRLAEGMAWHFFFMWFFSINGLLYVLYTWFSGEWRELLPNRHTLKESIHVVLHDLHLTKKPLPKSKFNGAQRIAYTGIVIMGFFSLLTGIAVYKPTQFAWLSAPIGGYQNARFIHFWLTMGYVVFFVIHVLQVLRAGWNNFRSMITGYELAPVEEVAQ
ncbi:thiosulfate reductase cytochrome subunit B-like protein [Fimbriimonas ginsengisoli Gsoil 348]|uniref:Thiosulfate reductase cytochrome subunit B-like protein n=2 Tax=Fimbriimonas ginsengisoli TaxID=1005039 RepID=A0A068NML5_FIMGI|nr:thiosulfate reductase cytochrome subunit B-like protein [Fimbriimonas ginsengisoli Gsoil 348]